MSKKKEPEGPIKKLILHFDINKTIMLFDSEKKMDKETQFNTLMASYAWGKLEQKDENSPQIWKIAHNHFVSKPPEEDCINYKEYIRNYYEPTRKYTKEDEPNSPVRNKYNGEQDQKINEMFNNFVKPGNAGIKLKPEYDRINKAVSLPKLVDLECQNLNRQFRDDENKTEKRETSIFDDQKGMYQLFSEGKYHLLPQFYKMMISLKKQKREFAIVFRTFGSDLKNVIREFNKFASGEHPCYSGRNNTPLVRFDGTKGTKNFVINKEHTGLLFRNGADIEQTSFVSGTLLRKNIEEDNNEKTLEDIYEKEIEDDNVFVKQGAKPIHVAFNELLQERCVLAIQDDYKNWDNHNKRVDNGKPLIVDTADYYTQHIFFDDHITDDDKTIVDVREVLNGNIIVPEKSNGKYAVRVETIDILKEPDYFMKQIEACEKVRAAEIEKIEKGIANDVELEAPKKSDFEILLEQSDSEYLRRTVIPLLHPALKLVDIERPVDPISFIALYCLKNQNKVKIPVPPEGFFDKKEEDEEEHNNDEEGGENQQHDDE